jgi:hypothetical protein
VIALALWPLINLSFVMRTGPQSRSAGRGARDGDLRSLAFDDFVALATDRERRVEKDGVPVNHAVR